MNDRSDQSWLGSVPYGGIVEPAPAYQQGAAPYGSYNANQGQMISYPRGGRVRIGQAPGEISNTVGLVAMTALGLGLAAGGGALLGYVIGRTQTAALIGAVFGLVTPPIVAAVTYQASPEMTYAERAARVAAERQAQADAAAQQQGHSGYGGFHR